MPKSQISAVVPVQRIVRSPLPALGLNLHLHALVIDGIYAEDEEDNPQFQVLLAPDTDFCMNRSERCSSVMSCASKSSEWQSTGSTTEIESQRIS